MSVHGDVSAPEEIFTEYAYFSSFSTTWVEHAKRFVDAAVRAEYGPADLVANNVYAHILDVVGFTEGLRALVADVLAAEAVVGLSTVDGHTDFAPAVHRVRAELVRFLLDAGEAGKTVVGYGAPGKGNTLLNYCDIRPDLLRYTVDRYQPVWAFIEDGHPATA
jgi:hypothetical protein